MDDGGEQMLQVDAFGKAVGGDKDALLGLFHVFHTLTALFRSELAGDGIDGGLGKGGLEVLGHVMGGGDIAAEHRGVIAIFKQGTDVPDERGQLGIALLAGQALCFGNEVVQAAGVLQLGGGLQVTAHEVVGFAIVQALVTEQVVIRHGAFQPRGQGLDGSRRRRGHAAQQGQGGVPDEAGATLLRVLLFNGFRHFRQ
jgi:hypothetical protein